MISSKEFIKAAEDLGREKGISRDILTQALYEAIVAATYKKIGKYLEPEVSVDIDRGLINILIPKEVSETNVSNWYEITIDEAKEYKENPQYGDILMVPTTLEALGRQSALVAKQKLIEKLKDAEKQVILDVSKDFEKLTGRKYGLFEEYKLDDAEIAIVCMNSTAGTTKYVVDNLRKQGIKAGLLKVRVFRPFPGEEIAKALSNVKAIAILDKADSLNSAGGALFEDVTSGMYVNNVHVPAVNYIYGIGGRDTKSDDIESVFKDLLEIVKTGKIDNPYRYLGLRKGGNK